MCPALFVRILALVIFSSLVACGGGGSSSGGGGGELNTAPIADAGRNQNVKVGDTVTLDASDSIDKDGDTLTYRWVFLSRPSGDSASLMGAETAKASFVALSAGQYVVELIVNDGSVDSDPVTVTVTAMVANSAPVADAGSNQSVKTGRIVSLDGRHSSDVDGDRLTYLWSFVQRPSGSTALLTDAASVAAMFTPDMDGEYRVALVVSDGDLESEVDEVVIIASTPNSAPVADAGTNQNVMEGDTITLDGSLSADADGDLISYAWSFVSKPVGSNAVLTGASTVSPTFTADVVGVYVVGLIVNDGELDSESVNVTITAAETDLPPVAVIDQVDITVKPETVIFLTHSSYDPNGTSIYGEQWQFVSAPEGSRDAPLYGLDGKWRVTVNNIGVYVLELTVLSNGQRSEPARTTITVEYNHRPTANAGENQFVNIDETVTLDGTASNDPNESDVLSYIWTMRSRPPDSAASLADPNSSTPTFVPDRAGDYIFELIVNDGRLNSNPVTVRVTAVEPLVDGLRLEAKQLSGIWSDVRMPYVSNASIEQSSICVGTCPTDITLHTYRITAIGGDYSLSNVQASVIGTVGLHLEPRINGLYIGQLIEEGQTVEFTLDVARVQVSGIDVQFSFDVVETGNRFEVNRTVTLQ